MSSSATFPADAATREFFLQTCAYRSESCYIMESSTLLRSGCMQLPCWWNVLVQLCPVLLEKGLGCSGGGRAGVGGGLFSRIWTCGEDVIWILGALVTFRSHAEGNPVSSLAGCVMSEFHCNVADMNLFWGGNCDINTTFKLRLSHWKTSSWRILTLWSAATWLLGPLLDEAKCISTGLFALFASCLTAAPSQMGAL